MIAALPAVAFFVCVGLGVAGWALLADRGAASRFALEAPARPAENADAEEDTGRRSLVVLFFEVFSKKLAFRTMALLGERRVDAVRHRLDVAGRPAGLTAEGYLGRKATFTVLLGGVGVVLVLQGHLLMGLVLVAAGWFWMDMWLGGLARKRQHRIDRDLPDFLDILAVTVGAGVGFRAALARVASAMSGPLAEEITTALRQLDVGVTRRTAFEDLRRRNDSEALNSLVTSLLQAEELGTPLSDALQDMSLEMRRAFSQQARRRAARAAPRISLIVTTVMVPGAIILMVATLVLGSGIHVGGVTNG